MRTFWSSLSAAVATIVYYIAIAAAEVFFHVEGQELGTTKISAGLEFLPFVLVLRAFRVNVLVRILSVLLFACLIMGTFLLGAWGMAGIEAGEALFLPDFPLLSFALLLLAAALPLRPRSVRSARVEPGPEGPESIGLKWKNTPLAAGSESPTPLAHAFELFDEAA